MLYLNRRWLYIFPHVASSDGTLRTKKSQFKRPFCLFPLGGYSFAVSSLQLHPVFGGISK